MIDSLVGCLLLVDSDEYTWTIHYEQEWSSV